MYTADNASGSVVEQFGKMYNPFSHKKRWATIREAAVTPHMQHTGTATLLGYLSLQHRNPYQPVSAYVLSESPSALRLMDQHPFILANAYLHRSFGPQATEVGINRFIAPSVGGVLEAIEALPGATEALAYAQANLAG